MTENKTSYWSMDEIIGWAGALFVLVPFMLLQLRVMHAESVLFLGMNSLGSFGICWISWRRRAFQPAIVNAIWFIFSVYGLVTTVSAH